MHWRRKKGKIDLHSGAVSAVWAAGSKQVRGQGVERTHDAARPPGVDLRVFTPQLRGWIGAGLGGCSYGLDGPVD